MITAPYFSQLVNAYCGAAATGNVTYHPGFSPLWSRGRHLTEEQIRTSDRLRKAVARHCERPFDPEADMQEALVVRMLFEQVKHRFDLQNAEDLNSDTILAVRGEFLVDKQVTDEEFNKWHGVCCLLLGLELGAFRSDNPRTLQIRSVLSRVRDDCWGPSQVAIDWERRAATGMNDFMLMCLQGLPEGTTLHRLVHNPCVAAERIGRTAALIGLTWQMAYLNAFLCYDGPGSLEHSPAPVPALAKPSGWAWSAGAAWIDALAAFEARFHGEPGKSRGPKSKVNPVASMLAEGKDSDHSDEAIRRKLKDLQAGRRALTYSDVQKVCSLTGKATTASLGAGREWEIAHFRLLVQGHVAGLLGYVERLVAHDALQLKKPEMLDDLHGVWQDWTLLSDHAISCLAKIYTDHGLQDVVRKS